MEIKIDTKKDSAKEIQHMIDFLTRFITAQESGISPVSTPSEPVSDGLFGMFGAENAPSTENIEQAPEPESEFKLEPY